MTPYETALRFMRQRDTTVSHPDFIAAYLREEATRTKSGNPLALSPNLSDRMRANREALIDSLNVMKLATGELRAALIKFGQAASRAGREMEARA